MVADLIDNLGALDYPREKLEILLLMEEDDTETIAAARAARAAETITLLIVPPGRPQTKPKACNVGLFFARGEFLVIYDAEDKPEPDQLKKAVVAFRRAATTWCACRRRSTTGTPTRTCSPACSRSSTRTGSTTCCPGLDAPAPADPPGRHVQPLPHRRRCASLGGWDPYNVTEDADLGIRAAALGYTVGVINSTTYEEANTAAGNWIRQRSRWIKGYMQTLLVHLRQPVALVREAGIAPDGWRSRSSSAARR